MGERIIRPFRKDRNNTAATWRMPQRYWGLGILPDGFHNRRLPAQKKMEYRYGEPPVLHYPCRTKAKPGKASLLKNVIYFICQRRVALPHQRQFQIQEPVHSAAPHDW